MSWNTLPPEVQTTAQEVLTPNQLAAWKLELAGLAMRAIGRHLDVARQTAADRIEAAHRALRKHGVHHDPATGQWRLTDKEPA